MSAPAHPFEADVVKYFGVSETDSGSGWVLKCKRCQGRWAFPKGRPLSIGGRLTLLDHAFSHKPRARKAVRS